MVLTLFAVYLGVGAWLLLRPVPDAPQAGVRVAVRAFHALGLHSMNGTTAEILCNVALFVPLPVLCLWLFPRCPWWWWPALGFLASGAVELFQSVLLPHRSGSVVDLVANTSGALIGAAVAWLLGTLTTPRARRAPARQASPPTGQE